tara:strand:- start:1042 stop:1551 length:510 start_codon:yes stop_codon:yes gene_type:complete
MIKYLKVIFTLLLVFNLNEVNAQDKIAFVDIDFLIKNSNIGKKTLQNINTADEKNIVLLKEKGEKLKNLENKIINKKNIISDEAYQDEVDAFQKKLKAYSNDKKEMVKNFNKYKKNELDKVFAEITPIIKDFMDSNSVGILIDTKNIFMGKIEFNLTEDILKEINKKIN